MNVEAFLDKLTTMTVSDIDREELDFPKVTFCPGFKPGAFKQSEDLINADVANSNGDNVEVNMADRLTHEDLKLSLYARGRGQVNCFDYYGVGKC